MIVRSKSNWWTLLFVWRGSMMKQMLPQLLIVAVLSVLAVWTEGTIFKHKVPLNATPFTLVGVALALFLGFRNSSAYDRWWEGRKLWGALVNTMRTLTRQALTMTGDAPKAAKDKREFIDMLVAFTYAMRDQLRGNRQHRDIALGRGHRQFRPGQQRQIPFTRFGERRTGRIDSGHGERAGSTQRLHRADQIGTLAGLRERESQLIAHLQRCLLQRRD